MKTLIHAVRDYMVADEKENRYSPSTIEKKIYQYEHLTQFLAAERLKELRIKETRPKHMLKYKEWLLSNTTARTREHVSRHIKLCVHSLNHAVLNDEIESNCLLSMEFRKDPVKEIIFLDAMEVNKLKNYYHKRASYQLVKNLFLFQCYTGLSYNDLWKFQVKDEIIHTEGKSIRAQLIYGRRGKRGRNKKQGKQYWAEFIPEAKVILDYYRGEFPKITLAGYNKIIKRIGAEVGIKKELTTHVGRKTFANIKRRGGYSISEISAMLGNTEKVAATNYVESSKELVAIAIDRRRNDN